MRRLNQIVRVLPLILASVAFTSCSGYRSYRYSDAPSSQVLLSPSPDFSDAAFLSRWTQPVSERDKINYLLGRITGSKYTFIRNGETHDGKTARQWFLYKMAHWVDHVRTAQDFVSRVAAYSQKTGEPYLVEFPDGRVYSLKSVLNNELSNFEIGTAHLKESQPRLLPVPQPGQVSISPTTVATTTVATSTTTS